MEERLIDLIANNINANQRLNCKAGPQVSSAVYTLAGLQVRIIPVPAFSWHPHPKTNMTKT